MRHHEENEKREQSAEAEAHRDFLLNDPWACYEDEDAACGAEDAEDEFGSACCDCCCCCC